MTDDHIMEALERGLALTDAVPQETTDRAKSLLRWRGDAADLSLIVQELVDKHGGLAESAYVQFWIAKGDLGLMNSEVGFVDSAKSPENAAKLTITFTPPG